MKVEFGGICYSADSDPCCKKECHKKMIKEISEACKSEDAVNKWLN